MAVGWMGILGRGLVAEDAHEGCFGDDDTVDGDLAGHLADGGFTAHHFHFDAELVARADGATELCVVDRGEEDEFGVAIGDALEDKNSGDLGHAFGDEDTGHNGKIWKMPNKEGLIGSYILNANDALFLQFDDPVHEEEGISVGKNVANCVYVENCHTN